MNALNAVPRGKPDAVSAATASGIVLSDLAARSSREAFSRSDTERVVHVLTTMRRALLQLEGIVPVDAELLERNSTAGLVIERVLANLMDMVFDVNCHVSGRGRTSGSFEKSCDAAIAAGLIDRELADALLPSEGPHHVVMQLSLDTEPELVEIVVARALVAFQEYERRAAGWVARPIEP
ncbi:hypothetical protein [Rhodococcus gannanensis]|uniref:Uncharacterized protein n=1 Tax=Rhodococcus gannanensis TaxID=1960308 RepID=A0ABW4P4F0_9NOCA